VAAVGDQPMGVRLLLKGLSVADLVYVLIVIAVFALIAVVVRGLEKL